MNWAQVFIGCLVCGSCYAAGAFYTHWWALAILLFNSALIQVALGWNNGRLR